MSSRSVSKPGFIVGIHDRQWSQGPPPVLLDEHEQMEAQMHDYSRLTRRSDDGSTEHTDRQ